MESVKLGNLAECKYTIDEATHAIVGYAFGTVSPTVPWSSSNPYVYAWHSYDTVLRDAEGNVSASDVLASTGLNSNIGSKVMLRLIALLENTNPLPDLTSIPRFWKLEPSALAKEPGGGHAEQALWDWYRLLTSLDGVAGAVMSKVVHHRHPTVMPLWDSKVAMAYREKGVWASMHADLNKHETFFVELERRFASYRMKYQAGDGVEVGRLRLLDILVWGEHSKNRSSMEDLGRKCVAASGAPSASTW